MPGFPWISSQTYATIFVTCMSSPTSPPEREAENRPYTASMRVEPGTATSRRGIRGDEEEPFGERMARLRKVAGYSQRSLARELGVSHRVIAYYEAESAHVPADLLPAIADALGVTSDQLLGRDAVTSRKRPENRQLVRKLRQVEALPPPERRQVVQLIDALLERHALRRQKAS